MFPPVFIYSDRFLEHRCRQFHFERPERLLAICRHLQEAFPRAEWREPTPVGEGLTSWLEKVHSRVYLEQLTRIAAEGGGWLDPDTYLNDQSDRVARLAVQAWLDGVDLAVQRQQPIFVLARPPGHHALRERGMGFCLLANGAIASHYALSLPKITRVAILDWDVHHGNGTQALVEDHPQIAYCSLHEFPAYPYTGDGGDRGHHNNVLNLPMPTGSTGETYRAAFQDQVIPFLQQFNPDLLIISAGYDAHRDDPLSSIELEEADYGWMMHQCLQITHRIVVGLEGGYDLDALGRSVVASVQATVLDGDALALPHKEQDIA
ncbi:histone deacetylase [Thermosynechococcus sichuanensis E542]|uniref:Histone deacetylase n=1 Tax=Thermosynechococcus sichuanensis E542 TaxID=2016101 RepID=A0A7D6F495_9CYAN|nr:histone deacetylase [Thermosynechococcus vestitus]QLL29923.1 histone deacetylase [Thermosynechococcus vestitus E542]